MIIPPWIFTSRVIKIPLPARVPVEDILQPVNNISLICNSSLFCNQVSSSSQNAIYLPDDFSIPMFLTYPTQP